MHQQDELAVQTGRVKERAAGRQAVDADGGDGDVVGDRLSKRILTQARQQLQELEEETEDGGAVPKKRSVTILAQGDGVSDDDDDDEGAEEPLDDLDWKKMASELRINQKDESAFDAFRKRPDPEEPKRTLADIIMEKIEERRTEIQTQFTDADSLRREQLDPRCEDLKNIY